MFLLFLDTETTGVDFGSDQIIELGAVLYSLDPISLVFSPVDHFQSTVALRQKLDDKISRITGITTEELLTALSVTKVQQKWNDWLDKYDAKIDAIIGHSIDFDLHFLNKEGWFLPTPKNIDTLSLSKILYPNYSAVNQEFLSKKLKLEQKIPFTDLVNLTHHRSLYDSIMCANLFGCILKELAGLQCSPQFIRYFTTNFLDLGLQFYPKNPVFDSTVTIPNPTSYISIAGKAREASQGDKISRLNQVSLLELDKLLSVNFSNSLRMVLCQIYSLNLKNLAGNTDLKFHAQGCNFWSYNFFNLIIEFVTSNTLPAVSQTIIPKYESIIDQMSQILDHSVNLGQIIEYLEILNQILIANDITSKEIQSVLSQYDFLIFTIQPLLRNCELKLALTGPNYQQRNFVTKFENLIENIESLEFDTTPKSEISPLDRGISAELQNLILFIRSQIKSQIDTIYFDKNAYYTFRVNGKYLSMTRAKKNYNLLEHFDKLLESKPTIQTYLTEQGFESLNQLANLKIAYNKFSLVEGVPPKAGTVELDPASFDYDFERLNNIDGLEFLQSKLANALTQKKISFVFCGLNSSMNSIQKLVLEDEELTRKTLIVGESGSLTKIASKIEQGFTGLVVIKFSSLNYFIQETGAVKENIAEVVIYDKPYFGIHNYWYNLAKQSADEKVYLDQVKELFMQAKVNFIHSRTGAKVEFVWNLG